MLVSCVTTRDNILVYEDGLTFIQNRKLVNEKLRKSMQQQRQFGILLIGIDSLSQFNVRRVMPRTFKYVENEDWFELSGYNKVNNLRKVSYE